MVVTSLRSWLKAKISLSRRGRGGARRTLAFQPRLEVLEDRLLLSIVFWDGKMPDGTVTTNSLWSNRFNWLGDATPLPGDDLAFQAFPAAFRQTNANDLLPTVYNSISFFGADYSITGSSIVLGAGGINNLVSGTNTLDVGLTLPANRSLRTNFGTLRLGGIIGGTGGLTKSGAGTIAEPGTLVLSGNNNYQGATTVSEGVLNIRDPSALGGTANGTNVAFAALLEVQGNISVGAEQLMLGGNLRSVSGTNSWAGNISLEGNTVNQVNLNVEGGSQLTLGGVIRDGNSGSPLFLRKFGTGRLILSGVNTYSAVTEVESSTLTIRNSSALGATSGGTALFFATLELEGNIDVGNELLDMPLFHCGEGAPVCGSGTLRSVSGLNSWAGAVSMPGPTLEGTRTVDVGLDSVLTLSGVVSGGDWFKTGAGFLTLSGGGANTFTGPLTVNGGRLDLNKSAGVTAVSGPLVVGSSATVGSTKEVRLLRADQIDDSVAVTITINALGLLNLNNRNDAIAALTMTGGLVSTGTGTLTLGANVTATSATNAIPAVIEGNLALGSATRTFTVPSGPAAVDVVINALISGPAGVGLTKDGKGTLRLTGSNNTYTGLTTVNLGRLQVDGTQASSPVLVKKNGTLGGNGTVGPITVDANGTVQPGAGAGLDSSGDVKFAIASTFISDLVNTPSGQLNATGAVTLTGAVLQVGLPIPFDFFLPPLQVPLPIIVANAGIVGTFSGLANGAIIGAAFPTGTILFVINYTPNVVFLTRISGPAFKDRTVTTPINEGGIATVTGTITTADPKDTFFLDVNWGDGSPIQTFTVRPNEPRTLSVTHRYLDDNPSGTPSDNYTLGLLWRDQRGAQNTGTLVVTVNNVAPTVFAGGNTSIHPGSTLARAGFFIDPGVLDTWTATVDYGDGSGVQALRLNPAHRFLLQHRFAQAGTFRVVVTIQDDDGGVNTSSFLVSVAGSRGNHTSREHAIDTFFQGLGDLDDHVPNSVSLFALEDARRRERGQSRS